MKHRTQLHLDEDQYRWLKRQAGGGSMAEVVRALIDEARSAGPTLEDAFLRWLFEEPAEAGTVSGADTIDEDVYGVSGA
jgi:predicted CopG family antitoxin